MRKGPRLKGRRYARFIATGFRYVLMAGNFGRGIILGEWVKSIWTREEALEAAGAICDERTLVMIQKT